ncbi:unnamed protein product [Durusdinium trenchii]|uniref:Cationic amino acid transporter n=1 Tax=Durusdinium trenchii TaxID=1381693 RepID=A0ABP0SFJ7_9DINO
MLRAHVMLAPRAAPGAALLPRGPRPSPRRRRADLVPRGADGGERRGARYGLADLVALSVASTVGSGVFSLAGRVASQEAGPAVVLSLGIGAMGCLLSATAYAELASRVVAAGSVYAYAQATGLGRSAMAVAALCLIVEYSWSCAAVSVDWSGKLLRADFGLPFLQVLDPAVLLVLFCTGLLINGTKASRLFTNVSTVAKVGLILFLIATALMAFDAKNLQPFIPEEYGISGILRGAIDSFFGFLGFDAVCALALDTKDARRVVPNALFLGLFVSGGLTCLAGFALVSAVPASRLDPAAGFVSAFEILGNDFAAAVVTVGELLVLPVVAFGCLLPLGRLLCCLAEDGFLPAPLARRDASDEPLLATLLGGAATAICAGLVPFEVLCKSSCVGCWPSSSPAPSSASSCCRLAGPLTQPWHRCWSDSWEAVWAGGVGVRIKAPERALDTLLASRWGHSFRCMLTSRWGNRFCGFGSVFEELVSACDQR